MQAEDAELEQFRRGVNCAALLEGWSPSWRLDRKESTRRALKYRREEGEVLIVNHDGRGWWDPQSTAKGDIFDLVQYLDPNLNFGQVRRELRRFVGVPPTFPQALSGSAKNDVSKRTTERRISRLSTKWCERASGMQRRLRSGSEMWQGQLYCTRSQRTMRASVSRRRRSISLRPWPSRPSSLPMINCPAAS